MKETAVSESKWTPEPWMPAQGDMPTSLRAAKRVNIVEHVGWGGRGWWTGHGKSEDCFIEGTPSHWFWLAFTLIGLTDSRDCPYSEDKPLPMSKDRVVSCVSACRSLPNPEADIRVLCELLLKETSYDRLLAYERPVADLARRWLAEHGENK